MTLHSFYVRVRLAEEEQKLHSGAEHGSPSVDQNDMKLTITQDSVTNIATNSESVTSTDKS